MDSDAFSKWLDRKIDELLLLVSTQAGILYVHRKTRRQARRMIPRVTKKRTAVAAGAGTVAVGTAAAATAAALAATAAAAIGLAAGGTIWYRKRSQSSPEPWSAPAPASDWSSGASAPAAPQSESSSTL